VFVQAPNAPKSVFGRPISINSAFRSEPMCSHGHTSRSVAYDVILIRKSTEKKIENPTDLRMNGIQLHFPL